MKKGELFLASLVVSLLLLSMCFIEPVFADVTDLERRLRRLEDVVENQSYSADWAKRIKVSGLIEVEAYSENVDTDANYTTSSDADLTKVDLAIDASIAKNVDTHFIFQYDGDDVLLDEGFVIISGREKCPGYLSAGYQILPFGQFDSHFITDPITKYLGETKEGSVVIGYRIGGDFLDISAGVYNGKTNKDGNEDDAIESFAAKVSATPIEGLTAGVAYISNIADADGLADQVEYNGHEDIDVYVGAWNAFVSFSVLDFHLVAEYIGALEKFDGGDLYATGDEDRQPSALNLELAYIINDAWSVAARYDTSDDGGTEFIPESQYGAIVNWGVFAQSNLGFEYLHSEYQDDTQTTDTITVQLAVEF